MLAIVRLEAPALLPALVFKQGDTGHANQIINVYGFLTSVEPAALNAVGQTGQQIVIAGQLRPALNLEAIREPF